MQVEHSIHFQAAQVRQPVDSIETGTAHAMQTIYPLEGAQ
jgi:hypothetical protein